MSENLILASLMRRVPAAGHHQKRDFYAAVTSEADSGPAERVPGTEGRQMLDEAMPTTGELLEAWREATRAADLAERLAKIAAETVHRANLSAEGANEVAMMAERAAEAATAAAQRARATADEAKEIARRARDDDQRSADDTTAGARKFEEHARTAYHEAEAGARARYAADEGSRPPGS